ncbi:hypothetical protein D3C72_2286370 [compost metagenome]
MPALAARNCRRTGRRSRLSSCSTDPSLRASTGSTQGIRLRMSPPSSAAPSNQSSERPPLGRVRGSPMRTSLCQACSPLASTNPSG